MIHKLATGGRLLLGGDWTALKRRWHINTADRRVRRHGATPFVNRDLGFRSVCHPEWPDSLDQFLCGAGDRWEFSLIRHWLRPGDAMFDLGANLGLYAAAALYAVGDSGLVVAVDADSFVVERLASSASLLNAANMIALQAAVTDRDGPLTFYVHPNRTSTFQQSLRPAADQMSGTEQVTVPGVTLSTLRDRYVGQSPPAAVKLDIEGAEAAALSATPPTWLGPHGPLWVVEINPSALAQFDAAPSDVVGHFTPMAFERWLMPKHPVDPAVTPAIRRFEPDELFRDSVYYNFIAVPKGAARQDRRRAIGRFLQTS